MEAFRRCAPILGICASLSLIAAPVAIGDTATCSYDAGAHQASILLTHQPLSGGTSMGLRPTDGALTGLHQRARQLR
jgi:hypothetical protein